MSTVTNKNIICSDSLLDKSEVIDLCVVLPAYNEGVAIRKNLLTASKIISKFSQSYRLIAVNDGSKDNTLSEIQAACNIDSHITYVSYKPNGGKGNAIVTGVSFANANYIAFLDSDLELSPAMLNDFLRSLKEKKADIAIGSKLHKQSQLEYPFFRRFLSMGYYFFLKILFHLKIKDTQTGIKLFKSEIVKPICDTLETNGFAFDIEILAKATKRGYKIIEMPIKLKFNRSRSEKSRFTLKIIANIFKETIKVKKSLKNFK